MTSTTGARNALAFAAAVLAGAGAAAAQDSLIFGQDVASVTYGPYFRAELGYGFNDAANGYWDPPNPLDPRIFFDLGADDSAMGAVAIGFDWQNGWRADLSLSRLVTADVSGPCIAASDGSACDTSPTLDNHTDIGSASMSSTALMANVFYAPREAAGSNSRFQPFVVGGIGVSRNSVGEWVRENSSGGDSGRLTRTFEGDTSTEIAWSLGFGAAWQVTRPGQRPVIVEASWRYYDFGSASGGATPLPGEGSGVPRQPLTFDARSSVVSIGVRIPPGSTRHQSRASSVRGQHVACTAHRL